MASYPGISHDTYYHIFNRGNNREDIFPQAENYGFFLARYADLVSPIVDTFAYCLMRNHFHFLVRVKRPGEIPEPLRHKSPGQVWGNFFNSYTKAFNKVYGRTGSLFERPFRRVVVASNRHLLHLVVYIHQNPQRHGFVADFRQWRHSSYHGLAGTQPTRLERETVHAWFSGVERFKAAHSHPLAEERLEALGEYDFGE